MLTITSLYAVIIGLMMVVMGGMVSIKRAKTGISILHGDDMSLAEIMRRHGNLAENAAMFVVLLALAELGGAGATWLHVAGIVFVAGRLAHPFGITHSNPNAPLRGIGALGNSGGMLIAMVLILMNLFA